MAADMTAEAKRCIEPLLKTQAELLANLQYETRCIDVNDPDAARYLGGLSVDFKAIGESNAAIASLLREK